MGHEITLTKRWRGLQNEVRVSRKSKALPRKVCEEFTHVDIQAFGGCNRHIERI